jgi:hypothetical protein
VLATSGSQQGSGPSHTTSPSSSTPIHNSPAPVLPPMNHLMGAGPGQPLQQVPRSGSPSLASLAGTTPPQAFSLGRDSLGLAGTPPVFQGQPPPGFSAPMFPPGRGGFGAFGSEMVPAPPPGLGPITRGFSGPPPPGFPHPPSELPMGIPPPGMDPPPHLAPPQALRQLSGGLESMVGGGLPGQTISRPAPIGRPGSVVHGQVSGTRARDAQEDESEHLGSGALEGAPEDPMMGQASVGRWMVAPGQVLRAPFPAAFDGGFPGFPGQWGPMGFGSAPPINPINTSVWSPAQPGPPFAGPGVAAASSRGRQQMNQLRSMLRQAYMKEADASNAMDGYVDYLTLFQAVQQAVPTPVSEDMLLSISEVEGSLDNGGGTFETTSNNGRCFMKWVPSLADAGHHGSVGAPGQLIGSPVIGSGAPFRGS